jgi:hypothetical protein
VSSRAPEDGYVHVDSAIRLMDAKLCGIRVLETPGRVYLAPAMSWVPEWAYAVFEATVPTFVVTVPGTDGVPRGLDRDVRRAALRRARDDEEFRGAVLAAWRLGGGAAAAQLVDATLTSAGEEPAQQEA